MTSKTVLQVSVNRVNREQMRFLNLQWERLRNEYRYTSKGQLGEHRMPAPLRAAVNRAEQWRRAEEKRRQHLREQITKALDNARGVFLFGTPKEALAAIEQAEKTIQRIIRGR